jgi:hypothetical protein
MQLPPCKQYYQSRVIVSPMTDKPCRFPCDRHAALDHVQKVGLKRTMLQPFAGVEP